MTVLALAALYALVASASLAAAALLPPDAPFTLSAAGSTSGTLRRRAWARAESGGSAKERLVLSRGRVMAPSSLEASFRQAERLLDNRVDVADSGVHRSILGNELRDHKVIAGFKVYNYP